MAKPNDNCKNYYCLKKYQCKRYCTESHEDYKNILDLKDECNEENKYVLFKSWRRGD